MSPAKSGGTTMTSIAADLEEAMLYTCLSNDKVEVELIPTDDSTSTPSSSKKTAKPKRHIALSPNGSFGSLEDSTGTTHSCDGSESDVSLCRGSSYYAPVYSQAIEIEQDGDCTTALWPNFFVRQRDQRLKGADSEGSRKDAATTATSTMNPRRKPSLRANTSIASRPPPLKKPALKNITNTAYAGLTSTRTKPRRSKRVRFAQVKVREYNVSLSQNPSCSEGPPIELGWVYREPPPVGLDTFEEKRQKQRRRLPELLLSDSTRRRILLQNYYTPQQITNAVREVEHLKRQRIMTYLMLPAAALDEAAEEIYDYWAQAFK